MTLPAPTYDLVLMLNAEAEEQTQAKILTEVRETISTQGELLRHDEWGDRALAYPIDHKATAQYHLLQFHANGPELLSALNHSLPITDGVVRYRIVKLKSGTPAAPDMRSAAVAGRTAEVEVAVAPSAAVAPAAAGAPPAAVAPAAAGAPAADTETEAPEEPAQPA